MMRKRTLTLGVVGALVTLLAPAGVAAPPAAAPQFGVTIGLDRTDYPAPMGGKPALLHASLTLFNRSAVPLKVTERGHQFDWQIVNSQGKVVWDYARGRMFAQFIRLRTLARGELTYLVDIPLQAQDGSPLPTGAYTLRGSLTTGGAGGSLGFSIGAAAQGRS